MLEVVASDERWDNTHGVIVWTASIIVSLRALDGASKGRTFTVVLRREEIPDLNEPRRSFMPAWLHPMPTLS